MVNRRRFIEASITAGIIGTAGCLGQEDDDGTPSGTDPGTSSGSDQSPTGSGPSGSLEEVGVSSYVTGGSWITAFWEAGELYAQENDIEWNLTSNTEDVETLISSIRQFTNQEYDGILAAIWDPSAANDAIKEATEADIPVFTADGDATSEHVKMNVAFGNENAGRVCGEEHVAAVREANPDQDSYRVLNFRGPLGGGTVASMRNDGFEAVIEEQDDFEIVQTINAEHERSTAKQRAQEWLNANDPPDSIQSTNLSMGLGVQGALSELDLQYAKGHEDHIVQTQVDAGPEVNGLIEDGYVDVAIDQPNYFYMPIALHYMQQWYDEGDDAIPEIGTEITADDLDIPSTEFEGVDLWSEPIWAPAQIVEQNGHPKFETQGVVVTEDNVNESYHWGNIWG